MNFKPHDRVVIGGRTMLAPGHSLVGARATVLAIGGYLPPGMVQLVVDDEIVEEEGGVRALLVNVPSIHLEPLYEKGSSKESRGGSDEVVPEGTLPGDANTVRKGLRLV